MTEPPAAAGTETGGTEIPNSHQPGLRLLHTATGDPEDLLRIRLHDAGVIEINAVLPRPHATDPAWQAVDGLAFGWPMQLQEFATALRKVPRPLSSCTFSVEVSDASGNDKANYNTLIDGLRSLVYVHKAGKP